MLCCLLLVGSLQSISAGNPAVHGLATAYSSLSSLPGFPAGCSPAPSSLRLFHIFQCWMAEAAIPLGLKHKILVLPEELDSLEVKLIVKSAQKTLVDPARLSADSNCLQDLKDAS